MNTLTRYASLSMLRELNAAAESLALVRSTTNDVAQHMRLDFALQDVRSARSRLLSAVVADVDAEPVAGDQPAPLAVAAE